MPAVRGQLDPKMLDAERRAGDRRKLRLEAYGSTSSERTDVLLLDVSTTGVLLETSGDLGRGETIELELPGQHGVQAVVKWASGNLFGCEFKEPVSDAVVSAALLRSPHLLPPQSPPSDRVDDAPEPNGKLPRVVRVQIVIGVTLLLWAGIAAIAFIALT